MNGSGLGRTLRLLGMAGVAAAIAATTVMPARAEDHDHDRDRRHERHYVQRDHREWRPYPGYVAPAPVYAPPTVVYAPPPAPVYAPPVAPSVNFVIPLRF